MSWATVAGLFAVFSLAAVASWAWTAICRRAEIKRLEREHSEALDELRKALIHEPDNLNLHCALRLRVLRLRQQLDNALG